ncbi:formate dehydrogenase subunit gamma [Azohydromonas caseinilytica]|uniref:Formate dehydrogenase subunit gamma n=1 Tax=Azohydromonas caseinilytica TaxID=2728836 RepID=A0A848F6Z6_9BURK|nr:formate dehydrogenase subunit gamma [Azohydromonas caseinilytica]NML14040.1 formate dehydrogenase subunit gamma [Azohydromonas caseinilytica]
MRGLIPKLLLAVALAGAGVPVLAQSAPPAGSIAPAAPAQPRADETNAERARSQPGNNAPLWRAVRESGVVEGTTTLPGVEKGVLIQRFTQYPGSAHTNAGEAWRQVRNRWLIPYGGALLLVVVVAIGLFYWRRGPMGHDDHAPATIERFTPLERAAHWVNAGAFCLLAISGIVMAFGKFFLLPVLGTALFGWLTYALKTAHNFAGPAFAVSMLVMLLMFARDNWPKAWDLQWALKGGGLFTGRHVPSHRFNAGEKTLFWVGMFWLGLTVVGSGLVLDKLIPDMDYTRGQMQVAHLVHAVSTILMMCLFLGHIYMGSIGVKGAYRAMRSGYVSEDWAREHHELWYDDVKAGKIPAQRSGAATPRPTIATPRA